MRISNGEVGRTKLKNRKGDIVDASPESRRNENIIPNGTSHIEKVRTRSRNLDHLKSLNHIFELRNLEIKAGFGYDNSVSLQTDDAGHVDAAQRP